MTQEKDNRVYPRENCVRCSRKIDFEDEGNLCSVCGFAYCHGCLAPGYPPTCVDCDEELRYRGDDE